MSNPSGLSPVGRAVLIRPYEARRMSSIIELPPETHKSNMMLEQKAIVVAVGESCWCDEPHPRAAEGDHVLVTKFAGYVATGEDGLIYRLVNDRDIFARITAPQEEVRAAA